MRYRCVGCGNEWEGEGWRSTCSRCGQTATGIPPQVRGPEHPEKLIQVLLSLQRERGWLSQETLREVSRGLGVPLSRVYQVATFYKAFSLVPRGKHQLRLCMGTACQIRGSPALLERLRQLLGVEPGETTMDGRFTLETVNCLGCCAMGPVMMVDGQYFGRLGVSQVERIVKNYG
ncbi:MAG: NAD(P)H-dependent oxidoreductase subunit E [Candidatus Hadarchaeales archaeon]